MIYFIFKIVLLCESCCVYSVKEISVVAVLIVQVIMDIYYNS